MVKIFAVDEIGNRVTRIAELYYNSENYNGEWRYLCGVADSLAAIVPGETVGLLLDGDTIKPADVENVERLAREIVLRGARVALVTCDNKRSFLLYSSDKMLLADRLNVPVLASASDRSLYTATVLEDECVIYNEQLF